MIISKLASIIFFGFLLSIGLWISCYFFVAKMYQQYRLELRHHIFSILVVITTFILYCSFSVISSTITGIENTLNSVKVAIIEKSDLIDVLPNTNAYDGQIFIEEINTELLNILNTNRELNDYIDIAGIDTQEIMQKLEIDRLSSKEKLSQIIDIIFETYTKQFTGTLNRIWWILLIVIIVVQIFYFGTMIYRAESKVKKNNFNNNRYAKTQKKYSNRSVNHQFRRKIR